MEAESSEDITDDMIKFCLIERSKIAENKIRVDHWDQIVKDVKMDMSIDDAEKRVFNLVVMYRNALRDYGYSDAITKNPEVAIKHIREKLNLAASKSIWIGFYELTEEADKYEYVRINRTHVVHDSIMPINTNSSPSSKRKREDEEQKQSVKSCRHFINKCLNSTEEEKKAFLKKYRESKEKRTENKSVKKIDNDVERSSTVFEAIFCREKLEAEVTADQGASANIMPKKFYIQLQKLDGVKSVHKLARQAVFDVFNKSAPPLTCDLKVTADVSLKIRHGKSMILRNVDWLIANESTSGILIGRQLLNALGLNNRVLLTAAMSKVGEDVGIPILYAS
ncbi:hypothetical protein FGB62_258g06 [Gracilaria domingensis]|nr:hypothetical protein FGB62_258g06 [Gracilaria domingensis]